uniref:Uncharacterized protein n=1 Tax=Triticum urartu TaxID=4572 RepID=A0A8R7QZE0_TRIUA
LFLLSCICRRRSRRRLLDPDPETQLDQVENWWKSLTVISSRVPDEQVQRTEENRKRETVVCDASTSRPFRFYPFIP